MGTNRNENSKRREAPPIVKMPIAEDAKGLWEKYYSLFKWVVGTFLAIYLGIWLFGGSTTANGITTSNKGGFFTALFAGTVAGGVGYVHETGTPEFAQSGAKWVSGASTVLPTRSAALPTRSMVP